MKINISENTVSSIIKVLNEYLNLKMLDENYSYERLCAREDIELIIEVSKALGELQGAVNAVKDKEDDK